jgi:hypothetical protein
VTWLHSYLCDDTGQMFCIYEAPTPEAIRRAAKRNGLPIESIRAVRVLDPSSMAPPRRRTPSRF